MLIMVFLFPHNVVGRSGGASAKTVCRRLVQVSRYRGSKPTSL